MLARKENIMTYTKKRTLFPGLLMLSFCLVLGMVSESSALTLLPPATITVPATDADGSYVVKWSKSSTATIGITYILQEATDAAFTSPRIVPHVTALSATITGRTTGETYYYRVRAKKTGWRTSTWANSTTGCFVKCRVGAPALITVPFSDADGSYEISWNVSATPGVTYVLQEATNSAFTEGRRMAYSGTSVSNLITGRAMGVIYYYRVKAIKSGMKDSAWTSGANGCEVSLNTLPDTGQTQCYNESTTIICPSPGEALFGQDAQYTANPMSHKVNVGGTVSDNVTGLMWQQQGDGYYGNWDGAAEYCNNLTLGDYADWRLPSRKELLRLVNYGLSYPPIDTTAFLGTQGSDYWSSTLCVSIPNAVWTVLFFDGYVHNQGNASDQYARCVRGEQGMANDFVINADSVTVTDNATRLVWQRQDDGFSRTWAQALAYCEGLVLAGHSDWRLPNVKELESIADENFFNPTIDTTIFPGTVGPYWSSTTITGKPSYAWNVDFYRGYVSRSHAKTEQSGSFPNLVRCVRNSQ